MDQNYQNNNIPMTPGSRRRWGVIKILATLLVTLIVFAGGVVVGRGDVQLKGLSRSKPGSTAIDYSSVDQLYSILKSDFDGTLDPSKLLDGLKTGLVEAAGDPYTQYFNPEDAKTFNEELTGSFTGIGAELGTDSQNNIVIVSPLTGYPADKAGLKPKDIISAVNGEATTGMSVDRVVQKIRGPSGTSVKLTISRSGQSAFDVDITRQQITIPSVRSEVIGNVGYLQISQFTSDTSKLAKQAAQDFKTKGVKGVVLDLRSDPGGYLSSAVDVSSLWLDAGKTVVVEKRGGQVLSSEASNGDLSFKGLPTVVLINSGSASASEITAGALHDNGAATIIGEKSFGKGSVQQVENLSNGAELKVTIARWYTPKGVNIDKQGITPDETVSLSDDDKKAGRDPQKDRAIAIVRSKIQ